MGVARRLLVVITFFEGSSVVDTVATVLKGPADHFVQSTRVDDPHFDAAVVDRRTVSDIVGQVTRHDQEHVVAQNYQLVVVEVHGPHGSILGLIDTDLAFGG